jgi:hypothetical protein
MEDERTCDNCGALDLTCERTLCYECARELDPRRITLTAQLATVTAERGAALAESVKLREALETCSTAFGPGCTGRSCMTPGCIAYEALTQGGAE